MEANEIHLDRVTLKAIARPVLEAFTLKPYPEALAKRGLKLLSDLDELDLELEQHQKACAVTTNIPGMRL